ncbi:MAG: response regulator transcription factor [Polaromonas sp.]
MLKKSELTSVEQHLLHALSSGASNKHMARHLGKSEFTIRNQLSTLFKKVNVSNRTQAVCWYREQMAHKEREGVIGTSVPLHQQQDAAKMLAKDSANEDRKAVATRE